MIQTFFYRKNRTDSHLAITLALIYGESAPNRDWHWTAGREVTDPQAYYGYGYAISVTIWRDNLLPGSLFTTKYIAQWVQAWHSGALVYPAYDCPWVHESSFYRKFAEYEYQIITPAQADAICRLMFVPYQPQFPQRDIPLSRFMLEHQNHETTSRQSI